MKVEYKYPESIEKQIIEIKTEIIKRNLQFNYAYNKYKDEKILENKKNDRVLKLLEERLVKIMSLAVPKIIITVECDDDIKSIRELELSLRGNSDG